MKNVLYIIIAFIIICLVIMLLGKNLTLETFASKISAKECKKKADFVWNGKKCVKKLKSVISARPLYKVALDKNNICATDVNGNVWCADDYNIKKVSDWKKTGTVSLNSVSLNNGTVCGTTKSGQIYCADNYKNPNFKKIKGPSLQFVIINNNTIIGLSKSGKIRYLDDYKNPKSNWSNVKTNLKKIKRIDLNNKEIIVADSKGNIHYASNYKDPKWQIIKEKMQNKIDLAIDSNGNKSIVGLNNKDNLTIIHNFNKDNSKKDVQISTYLDTSASYGNVCGIDFGNQLHCNKIT